MWKGWLFHDKPQDPAVLACINARFSLIAVACKRYFRQSQVHSLNLESGAIDIYVAKDYTGNIPFSHRIIQPRTDTTKTPSNEQVTQLMYSPDGHALFVTTERGWYLWSVYGHLLASSLHLERSTGSIHEANGFTWADRYMDGLRDCCWSWSGLGAILLGFNTRSLYLLPFARSAITNCYNPVSYPLFLFCKRIDPIGYDCSTNLTD